jgi:hypothetical protein
VKRDCNSVSYNLAKVVVNHNVSDCCLEEASDCIADLINRELLCL